MESNVSSSSIAEYTDRELRGQADEEEIKYLEANRSAWLAELVNIKRRAETQMTSCRARRFALHQSYSEGDIELKEFNGKMDKENIWRTNANRFLQQIEYKMLQLRHYDTNSGKTEEH